MQSTPRSSSLLILLVISFWLISVGAAFVLIERYANQPGDVAASPVAWPAESGIASRPGRPHLLMFVHPQCPCSRASVSELERLCAKAPGGAITAVVVIPEGAAQSWAHEEMAQRLRALDGVATFIDVRGVEAKRFGARTSGAVLVFDGSGRLCFCGGITSSRGNEGQCEGGEKALACMLGKETAPCESGVFGCPLENTRGKP